MLRFLLCAEFLLFLVTVPVFGEDKPIKLGAIFSLSGFGASAGQGELNGTVLAVEEINQHGGVRGRQLELVVEDNQSDFSKTATAFRKLANIDRVPVVFGPNWAEFAEVAAPLAEGEKVVLISATGYTAELVKNRSYVFSGMPAHEYVVEPFAQKIIDQHYKKIALLVSENAYYGAIADILQSYFKRKNEKLALVQRFQPPSLDFRTVVAKLKRDGFDAVVLFLLEGTGGTASFLRQAKEARLEASLYSGPSILFDDSIRDNPSIAEKVIFFDYRVPNAPEFEGKYESRFGIKRILGTTKAYDLVYLVKKAIEKCGEGAEQIRNCLRSVQHQGVTGQIAFEPDGNFRGNTYVMKLVQVDRGKYVDLETLG